MLTYRLLPTLALPLMLATGASAQTLALTSGVSDEQVLQRGPNELADLKISGTAQRANNRVVEARVWHKEGPLEGFDWKPLGKIQRNAWIADVKGIPTGGPYRLDLRIAGLQNSMMSVNNLLVGDIWVLAGQSNMEGVGNLENVETPHDLIHSFDMTDRWTIAEEPLHTLVNAADKVHWRRTAEGVPEKYEGERLQQFLAARKKGAGLGLAFAHQMLQRTGVPMALLPCAHGGTSMDQWSPSLKDKAGESLYGAMLRRVRVVGGRVKGVLWYQGESDANPKAAPDFQSKFEAFVTAVRRDLGQQDLPFYYVQIGRHVSNTNVSEWNSVQDAQRRSESSIPRPVGMVPSVDLGLDDVIHIGSQDLKRLGARLAKLACKDLFQAVRACQPVQRGPRPESVQADGNLLRVKFAHVNGGLKSEGRIGGFSIHNAQGEAVPMIYKVMPDRSDAATILLHIQGKMPEGAVLRYAAGKDPYCNVRDEADMAVPAFSIPIVAEPSSQPAKPAAEAPKSE